MRFFSSIFGTDRKEKIDSSAKRYLEDYVLRIGKALDTEFFFDDTVSGFLSKDKVVGIFYKSVPVMEEKGLVKKALSMSESKENRIIIDGRIAFNKEIVMKISKELGLDTVMVDPKEQYPIVFRSGEVRIVVSPIISVG